MNSLHDHDTASRALLNPPKTLRTFLVLLLLFASGVAHAGAQKKASAKHAPDEHAASKQQKQATVYACPMHPKSVRSKTPGKCPKCGMVLRPTTDADESAADSWTGAAAATTVAGAPKDDVKARGSYGGGGRLSIPDVELVNQDGRKVHFYTDLVKDRVVVINFIFTTCTTICPPLGATFARVQKDLGERAGRDVHFISVSVDPVTDTPERLKAWGEKFHAGASWTFVTGDKSQIDQLLRGLAAETFKREDHSPNILVVNDLTGTSTRTYGLAKPSQLVEIIDKSIAGKTGAAESSSKE